jgi:hypothetical protein
MNNEEEVVFKQGAVYNHKMINLLNQTLEFNEKFLEVLRTELDKVKIQKKELEEKDNGSV